MPAGIADIYDWVAELRPDQWVLDVGAGAGSFPHATFSCHWLALDDDAAAYTTQVRYCRAVGTSQSIPVRSASIDLVVCHHALEHLPELGQTLEEMGRVLKPDGRCYVSIPNGYGLCDAVYRGVFEGGGHINRFRRDEITARIERTLGVRLTAWQKLYSSFVYLRKLVEFLDDAPPDLTGRLRTLQRLPRASVAIAHWALYGGTRLLDRYLRTDLCVYGWAFFFERGWVKEAVEQPGYVNVCPYCGTGQPAAAATRVGLLATQCPNCSRRYPYTSPFRNAQ